MRDTKADIELVLKFRCLADLLTELERDSAEVYVWLDWVRLARECAGEIEARVAREEPCDEDAQLLEIAGKLRDWAGQVEAQLLPGAAAPHRAS